jgi:DNA repair protein NreA
MRCKICGNEDCKKHSILLAKAVNLTEFSGSSPPEIFVGKWNYPNVYTGILSPTEFGNTSLLSSHEEWHEKKLPISQILDLRNQLIYSRTQSNIKKPLTDKKFLPVMQEVAMTHKSVGTEFKLKKPLLKNKEQDSHTPLIPTAANIENARLTENPQVKPKINYLVNDTDVKSRVAMLELEKAQIPTSNIVKILSAGLLGIGKNRKLVPTRWSITAVDDALSKNKLNLIRYFSHIQDFQVHSAEYLGNHYEFLLLPGNWEFEVIEISMKNFGVWHDHESFFPRKHYAESVTGAYYANRLALTEYLEKIKRQCSAIVFREVRPEYYAPMGVGILRQTSREAFSKSHFSFSTLKEALANIQSRIRLPIHYFTDKSVILKEYGKQKTLNEFF